MSHSDFKDLRLDDTGLQTPNGFMPLGAISKADFTRHTVEENGTPDSETTSAVAVGGGAVVGAVVAGPVGAVVGGLAGSTVKTERPGEAPYRRTLSATIAFEAGDVSYSTDVAVFDVEEAEAFVDAVRSAAGLSARS